MGTASTMRSCWEAMGLMLPGGGSIPAVHAERFAARGTDGLAGRSFDRLRAKRCRRLLSEKAFAQRPARGFKRLAAAPTLVIHLIAIAGRCGLRLDPGKLDEISDTTPLLVDLKPSGQG